MAELEDEIVKARAMVLDANFNNALTDSNVSTTIEEKSDNDDSSSSSSSSSESSDKNTDKTKKTKQDNKGKKTLQELQISLQQSRADLSRLQEKHEKTEALMVNILGGIIHVTSELLPISGVRTAEGEKCEKDYRAVDIHNAHITDAEDMLKSCYDKLTNIGNIVGLPTEADINDEQLSETDAGLDGKLRSPTSPIVSVQNIPGAPSSSSSSSAARVSQSPGPFGRTRPGSVTGMNIQSGISGVGTINPIVDRATMKRRAEEISRKRKEKEMEEKEKAGLL